MPKSILTINLQKKIIWFLILWLILTQTKQPLWGMKTLKKNQKHFLTFYFQVEISSCIRSNSIFCDACIISTIISSNIAKIQDAAVFWRHYVPFRLNNLAALSSNQRIFNYSISQMLWSMILIKTICGTSFYKSTEKPSHHPHHQVITKCHRWDSNLYPQRPRAYARLERNGSLKLEMRLLPFGHWMRSSKTHIQKQKKQLYKTTLKSFETFLTN